VICEVERFGAELHPVALGDRKRFEERHVPLRERWADNGVPSDCPKFAALRPLPEAVDLAVGCQWHAGGRGPAKLARVAGPAIQLYVPFNCQSPSIISGGFAM